MMLFARAPERERERERGLDNGLISVVVAVVAVCFGLFVCLYNTRLYVLHKF